MKKKNLQAEAAALVMLLKECATQKDVRRGTSLHASALKRGLLGKSSYVANTLISMYAKWGALSKAHMTLDEMAMRDVVSWSSLIAGFAQHGHGHDALHCFEQMQGEGISPNAVTFSSILKACGSIGAPDKGKQIHDEIVKQELLENNVVLGNALVDMYAKSGALSRAQQVLAELSLWDIVSWNTLIAGYAQQGQGQDAFVCFKRMQWEGFAPNRVTFLCALKACSSDHALNEGAQIHVEIAWQGLLDSDVVLGNALVDMYAKCGALIKAEKVLKKLCIRDTFSWNAIIAGCTQQHRYQDALNYYEQMLCEGLSPDVVTFLCILKACGSIEAVEKGERIHDETVRKGLIQTNVPLGTALVDMYAKCGAFGKAQQVLEEFCVWDVVSWNALITGYVRKGLGEEAFNCFDMMRRKGISADEATFTCVLKACGSIGVVEKGEQVHDEIVRQGLLGGNQVLGTALVDMYAKCGAITKAEQVLEKLPSQDVVSWSSLVALYAKQGLIHNSLHCIECMEANAISPNAVTLLNVLYACSHSGLVEEGQMYFAILTSKFGIMPDLEHYTCIADLLGRAGHFDKAMSVIQRMPSSNFVAVWYAVMGACRKWGNVNVGRWAFDHAVQIDKSNIAAHISMINLYLAAGMHDDAKALGSMRFWKIHASDIIIVI
ncbi:hypothetical protein GOP47_0006839 [Adiantum capillus-veneris]|uniref:Pentatricopeptide repeat-containing protein n=1 Tax=Adiantum capillus-veneris TaxID=13818 RepID=A0A9D4V3V3_ADICA|nr:hypothetical protein GOP47_0006839 [Adiantum capillus-veneris]